MSEKPGRVEEFVISGENLISKVKELLHEGDIRRISLQTEEGKTLIEVPLTFGVAGAMAGALIAPVWAAVSTPLAIPLTTVIPCLTRSMLRRWVVVTP